MKLVTFMHKGITRIGVLVEKEEQQYVLDLNKAHSQLPTDMIAFLEAGKKALSTVKDFVKSAPKNAIIPKAEITLLAPVPRPGKIILLGHNYFDHSAKAKGEVPEYPTIFSKYANTVIGTGQSIVLPRVSEQVDNEAELGCIIGKRARNVKQEHAFDYVVGYTIFNDVSARDYGQRCSQWMLGKTFDTFGPMGPALVTKDEIPEPDKLELILTVNDQKIQHGSTRNFIFPIPFLISYLSEVMTLEPGDIISTGTPSRLGEFRDNPIYMKPGDEVRIKIDKIGELCNTFVAETR
jgi:acylpyruvate hydrolase